MSATAAAFNIAIAGFYSISILWHMIRPGEDTGYTRMLMFAFIGSIPLGFMTIMIGGRDRWPMLAGYLREFGGTGAAGWLQLAGLGVLVAVLPLVLLAGAWYGMGLKFGTLFIAYFTPLMIRFFSAGAQEAVATSVAQGVLLFASFFAGMGIVWLLARFLPQLLDGYTAHMQVIWPGYRDAATMFFSVCVFGFVNQLLEARPALQALLSK